MGHSHTNDTPLGLSDVIAGAIIFTGLWWIAVQVAGPEGVGFLKNLLTEQRSFELLVSGLLFLFVWLVLGNLVIVPFLDAFYEREEKTSGAVESSHGLKNQIAELRTELEKELHLARVEGVKRRNERLIEAKKKSDELLDAEKRAIGEEISRLKGELQTKRVEVLASLEVEVDALSSTFYQRLTSVGSQTIH